MAVIEAIATTYLEADASSVTFSSIPQTYEHLQLRISSRSSDTGTHSPDASIRFNGDTGTNYSWHYAQGDATAAAFSAATGASSVFYGPTSGSYGESEAAAFAGATVDILDYVNANKNTTLLFTSCVINAEQEVLRYGSGLWENTSAVTQIDLLPTPYNWGRGSEFTLYGLNSS